MKKIYFVDEEETNRILNLHESETKRQYLSEELPYTDNSVNLSSRTNKLAGVNNNTGTSNPGKERDVNWNGIYACVTKAKGAVKSRPLEDGSTAYILNGYVYYNNGFKIKQPVKNNKGVKYTCNDPEFKSGVSTEDKAKKTQQYKQQVVTKTSDTTKQIQK